ncbi:MULTISPECIES: AAA family ATPase [Hallella]
MTGQRRAGKSWLMRQIVTELLDRGMAKPHQILYINVIKSIKCVNNYSTFYILPATV